MIYIFSGCQAICSLPGYACGACSDALKQCPGVCQAICDPLRAVLKGAGSFVKHFFERPLSAYVVVSFLLSGATLYLACADMAAAPKGCSSNYLYALMTFALINVIFAIYVQWQVWRHIMADKNQERFICGDRHMQAMSAQAQAASGAAAVAAGGLFAKASALGGAAGAAAKMAAARAAVQEETRKDFHAEYEPTEGNITIPKEVVQDAFKEVFMEDLGVLAMFIGLLGIFILSLLGPNVVLDASAGQPCEKQVSENTKYCGYAFFWVASAWTFTYSCCSCCSNKVAIAKPAAEDTHEYTAVPS